VQLVLGQRVDDVVHANARVGRVARLRKTLDQLAERLPGVARGLLVAADDAIAGRVAALLDLASLAPASTDAVTPGPGRP
jgi:hypothetical protein